MFLKQALLFLLLSFFVANVEADPRSNVRLEDYEGRLIVSIELAFENSPPDSASQAEFLSLLKIAAGNEFSTVRVRDSLQSLFDSGRIANARVEVVEQGNSKSSPIRLKFIVQRQVQIGDVRIDLGVVTGSPISTDELRARLNFVQPGTRLSKQLIARNADEIQVYLRDRGYFNATVESVEQLDPNGIRATVTYKVNTGEQAKVESFAIDIKGFDPATVKNSLVLQPGVPFHT
jgi:outer membrane protein assembly factor BamA